MTPDEARAEAKRLLGEVSAGRDPAEQRHKERAGDTLGDAIGQFLSECVDTKLKAQSAREYRRIVHLHILPAMKNKRLGNIQRPDIAR